MPPVETSSKPSATRPRPSSARPVLSETDRRARRGTARRDSAVSTSSATVRPAPAAGDRDRPGEEPGDHLRQQPMLDRLDPLVEGRLVVARRRIGTASWATIGPPSSVASTRWTVAPVTFTPWARRVADRVGARERRQEARVGVQDPAGERVEDRRPDDPHVAGEDDDIRPGALEDVVEDARRRRRARGRCRSPAPPPTRGPGQARSATTSTISPPTSPRTRRRVERPEVGARLPRPRPRSVRSPDRLERPLEVARPVRAVTRDDLADHDRLEALRAERVRSPRPPRSAPTTTTIPIPALNVARISTSSRPRERRDQPDRPTARARSSGRGGPPRSSGTARGTFVASPPPVTWARPRTSAPAARRVARARRRAPGVDRGRGEEHLAQRREAVLRLRRDRLGGRLARRASAGAAPGTAGRGRGPSSRSATGRASSRCCGARSTAGRASTSPARAAVPSSRSSASTTPTQNPARSNSPGCISPGCSAVSPPTSAQPASRQPSAMPDDELGDLLRVEPPDGDVVEEEQRLGAAAGDVVGAHRDEIAADRVVAADRGGDRGLRADAVGRRDEHRRAVAGRDRDRRAEAAEARRAPPAGGCASTAARIRSTARSPAATSTPAAV